MVKQATAAREKLFLGGLSLSRSCRTALVVSVKRPSDCWSLLVLRPAREGRANFSHPEYPEIKFLKGKDKDSQKAHRFFPNGLNEDYLSMES